MKIVFLLYFFNNRKEMVCLLIPTIHINSDKDLYKNLNIMDYSGICGVIKHI